jgi:hypothetical protein
MAEFVYALDVSSSQERDLDGIIGMENPLPTHIVVRMYLPGERPPRQYSIDQVNSARAAGCSVGAYLWAYGTFDPRKSVADALALAKGGGMDPPAVLWLDCETYTDGSGDVLDPGPNPEWLRAAVDECTQRGVQAGIYTGHWWWKGYMGDTTEFGNLPLWIAQYDGVPNPTTVNLFGGWRMAYGKQWSASGLDRDAFLPEATIVGPPHKTLQAVQAANPNIISQLETWHQQRIDRGLDPLDYPAFRQFQISIGAPDPGAWEFDNFRPTSDTSAPPGTPDAAPVC